MPQMPCSSCLSAANLSNSRCPANEAVLTQDSHFQFTRSHPESPGNRMRLRLNLTRTEFSLETPLRVKVGIVRAKVSGGGVLRVRAYRTPAHSWNIRPSRSTAQRVPPQKPTDFRV